MEATLRQCPFCKEDIKADATRCKNCRSTLMPEKPAHGGTCPFCKEDVNPEAIKCKHCASAIGPVGESKIESDCGCGKTALGWPSASGFSLALAGAKQGTGGVGSGPTSGVGIPLEENCGGCYPVYRNGIQLGGTRICCTVTIGPYGVPMLSCRYVPCGDFAGLPPIILEPNW
jgi:hypothetical protein